MEIKVQSIHFDADKKLLSFIQENLKLNNLTDIKEETTHILPKDNYKKVNPLEPHYYNTIQPFNKVPAFIAHYLYQSYETYLNDD